MYQAPVLEIDQKLIGTTQYHMKSSFNDSQHSLNWEIVNESISKNANLGSMESSKPT